MNKPIKEWTLEELKAFCIQQAVKYGDNCCTECPIDFCMSTPDNWQFEKEHWQKQIFYACSKCGHLSPRMREECPDCHSPMEA